MSQFPTALPGATATLYAVHFTLPDGDHLMAVHSHPTVIRQHMTNIVVEHNERLPDAPMKVTKYHKATPEQLDQLAREIHERNPDRLTVDEKYGAQRNKLLYENREQLMGEAMPDEDLETSKLAVQEVHPVPHPQNTFFPVPVTSARLREVVAKPPPLEARITGTAKKPPDLSESLE